MKRKAVIVGATGLIGKELFRLLLDDLNYINVTILVRRSTGITHPKLDERIIDFDKLEQAEVNLSGADVFCSLGTTIKKAGSQDAFLKVDYSYPLTLGQMAKAQEAKQVLIITSMGANPTSPTFYTRVKGEIEADLGKLKLPALHIFRPSLLLGDREEFRMGERFAATVSKVLSPLFVGPIRKYKPIQAHTVANAMVCAAKKDYSGIQTYESDQISQMGTST